jgi:hypothetical protein
MSNLKKKLNTRKLKILLHFAKCREKSVAVVIFGDACAQISIVKSELDALVDPGIGRKLGRLVDGRQRRAPDVVHFTQGPQIGA